MTYKGKKVFAVTGIIYLILVVITVICYSHLFLINPNWGEFHSLFYTDTVWIDSSNRFTLSLNQYNEYGILTKDGGNNSFVIYFELSDPNDDHNKITVKKYESEESTENITDDSEAEIYGGWEYYEDTEDTLIIWTDKNENSNYFFIRRLRKIRSKKQFIAFCRLFRITSHNTNNRKTAHY